MMIRKTTLIFIITFFTICLLSCGEEGIRDNLGEVYHIYDSSKAFKPFFFPSGDKIVFVERDIIGKGSSFVYYFATIDENGDNYEKLDMGGIIITDLCGMDLSYNGEMICFSAIEIGSLTEDGRDIYIMSSDGGDIERIDIDGKVGSLCFSADGEWIYFVMEKKNLEEKDRMYRIRTDGSDLEYVGIEGYCLVVLTITPDNKYIIYNNYNQFNGDYEEVIVKSLDGEESWVVLDETVGGLTVSPDCRWICYSGDAEKVGYDLFVVPFNGGEKVRITDCGIGYLKLDGGDFSPDWSKDGKWIVFSAIRLNGEGIFKVKVPDEFLP